MDEGQKWVQEHFAPWAKSFLETRQRHRWKEMTDTTNQAGYRGVWATFQGLPHTLTHFLPHTLSHTLFHILSHTLSPTHTLSHSLPHTLSPTHALSHSLPHTLSHTFSNTHTRSSLFTDLSHTFIYPHTHDTHTLVVCESVCLLMDTPSVHPPALFPTHTLTHSVLPPHRHMTVGLISKRDLEFYGVY